MSHRRALYRFLEISPRAPKLHYWFKSYKHFAEWLGFACWWSCIGKGLSLQPAQQPCFYKKNNPLALIGEKLYIEILFWNYSNLTIYVRVVGNCRTNVSMYHCSPIRTFSPVLTSNYTSKYWSDNFSKNSEDVFKLDNVRSNISTDGRTTIQGKRFKIMFQFYEARISECDTYI